MAPRRKDFRRGNEAGPGCRSVHGLHECKSAHIARHGHRATGAGPAGKEIVARHLTGIRVVNQAQAAAAKTGCMRHGHRQVEIKRGCRIDGRAPGFEDGTRRKGCARLIGHNGTHKGRGVRPVNQLKALVLGCALELGRCQAVLVTRRR